MLILLGNACFEVRQLSDQIMNKTEFYADLNRDFQALMAGETSFLAMISNTSALLFERLTEEMACAEQAVKEAMPRGE